MHFEINSNLKRGMKTVNQKKQQTELQPIVIYMKRKPHIPIETERALRKMFPDSEAVFTRAAEAMLLKADRCSCDAPVIRNYNRIPSTRQYKCRRCKKIVSPLVVTPLGRAHKNLTDTIHLACRFYYAKKEIPPMIISELYGCKYETAKRKSSRVIQWMKLAIAHNIPAHKNINNTKVIKIFSANHDDFTSAVDALFHALPSLGDAISK